MKFLAPLTLVILSSLSVQAFAKIECTTDSNQIDYVEMYQDGGEETVAVHLMSEKVKRFTVMENDYQGRIVAMINGNSANKPVSGGVILLINQATKKANFAYEGQVFAMECK